MPLKFQEIMVNMLNKAYPDLQEIREKFLEACVRYEIQNKQKRTASEPE